MQDVERAREGPIETASHRWLLLGACAIAVSLRVAYVLSLRADPFFFEPVLDAAYHLRWAQASAAGERFVEGPYFRAPGYPEFLGLCLRFASRATEPLTWVRLIQAFIGGCVTIGLVWRISRLLDPVNVSRAFAASLLAAFSWPLVAYDGELLLPALAVPLNLLALERTLAIAQFAKGCAKSRLLRAAALAGLAYGLAALVRPNILLFVPFAALWISSQVHERRQRWIIVGSFILATLLVLAPITIRNARASSAQGKGNDFVLVSSQAGLNLWIGNHPNSDGMSAIAPGLPADLEGMMLASGLQAESESGHSLSASGISQHFTNKTWRSAVAAPSLAAHRLLWKARLFWSAAEPTNTRPLRFFGERFAPWPTRLAFVRFGSLLALALAGVLLLPWRSRQRDYSTLLVGFAVVYSLSVIPFFITERFRVPIVPVLCIFAGGVVAAAIEAVRPQATRSKRRAGVKAILATLAFGLLLLATRPSALPKALGGAKLSHPEAAGVWLLAQRAGETGDPAAAESGYREALSLRPDLWIAHRDLGQSLAQTPPASPERLAQARIHLERATQLFPGVETFPALISLELIEGRVAAAREAAEALIRLAPGLAAGPYQLGRVAAATGDLPGALRAFEEALKLEPGNFDAAFARARMLQDSSRADTNGDTQKAWQLAVQLADQNSSVDSQWAWAAREAWLLLLVQSGEARAAAEYLERPWNERERLQALALARRLGL